MRDMNKPFLDEQHASLLVYCCVWSRPQFYASLPTRAREITETKKASITCLDAAAAVKCSMQEKMHFERSGEAWVISWTFADLVRAGLRVPPIGPKLPAWECRLRSEDPRLADLIHGIRICFTEKSGLIT